MTGVCIFNCECFVLLSFILLHQGLSGQTSVCTPVVSTSRICFRSTENQLCCSHQIQIALLPHYPTTGKLIKLLSPTLGGTVLFCFFIFWQFSQKQFYSTVPWKIHGIICHSWHGKLMEFFFWKKVETLRIQYFLQHQCVTNRMQFSVASAIPKNILNSVPELWYVY